jgi:hypothetical protein
MDEFNAADLQFWLDRFNAIQEAQKQETDELRKQAS